jgi:hypothetical protein
MSSSSNAGRGVLADVLARGGVDNHRAAAAVKGQRHSHFGGVLKVGLGSTVTHLMSGAGNVAAPDKALAVGTGVSAWRCCG